MKINKIIVDETEYNIGADYQDIDNKPTLVSKLDLSLDNNDYKLKGVLKDANDNVIYTSNEIDLPLESMVINATYDNTTKEIVLTLQSGSTTRFSVADLVSGLVSTSDLNTALASKQDTLIAGDNITIENNVISASGGGGSSDYPEYTLILESINTSDSSSYPYGNKTFSSADQQRITAFYEWKEEQTTDWFYLNIKTPNTYSVTGNQSITGNDNYVARLKVKKNISNTITTVIFFWNKSNSLYNSVAYDGYAVSISLNKNTSSVLCYWDRYRILMITDIYLKNNCLLKNNTTAFVPTKDYHPSTKLYTDKTHYENMTGYDATKTQVLKNIQGTLTWVDEE